MHKIEAFEVMSIGFMTLVVAAFYTALGAMKKKEIWFKLQHSCIKRVL